jgi:hypothetical protein
MIPHVNLHVSLVTNKIIMKSRRMRWARHVARMEEKKRNLVGKPEGKEPLGRPRHRLVDNIKIDLREIGWGDIEWIHLAQGRDSGGLL